MSTNLPPVFFDTSAWIDIVERRALMPWLEAPSRGAAGLGKAHTSDFVLLEAYSFIARNHRREAALRFLALASSPAFIVHPPGGDVVDDAVALARERRLGRDLSLVDWTTAVIMERHRIRHILTHDRAFGQLGFEVLP